MTTQFTSGAFATRRQSHILSAIALTANLALAVSFLTSPAMADQASKSAFDRAPRLVRTVTDQPAAFVSGGTYTFTLTVPQDAGAPLQAVSISQPANAHKVTFLADQSQVIANGATVPVASIGGTASDDLVIAFDRPIQPGSTVTISLIADQNPVGEGTYLFGVTAYPVGDDANGLFLGYGRVALFDNQ